MNKQISVDLAKCYALVDQVALFEKIVDDQLSATELLRAFNTTYKQHETPLLILFLNQMDYYACERILATIANNLEDYFRQALNHTNLVVKSEQAQRMLFSITDKNSNRELIRFSMTEKKFAITHTYPKNLADYNAKKERYSKDYLQKESYYNDSIDYLKNCIQVYEETPYKHFSEVKRVFKKFGTLAAVKVFFNKKKAIASNTERNKLNNNLLDVMTERLNDLLAEQSSLINLDNDFALIQGLRPGINESFVSRGYEEVDYKKMYKN